MCALRVHAGPSQEARDAAIKKRQRKAFGLSGRAAELKRKAALMTRGVDEQEAETSARAIASGGIYYSNDAEKSKYSQVVEYLQSLKDAGEEDIDEGQLEACGNYYCCSACEGSLDPLDADTDADADEDGATDADADADASVEVQEVEDESLNGTPNSERDGTLQSGASDGDARDTEAHGQPLKRQSSRSSATAENGTAEKVTDGGSASKATTKSSEFTPVKRARYDAIAAEEVQRMEAQKRFTDFEQVMRSEPEGAQKWQSYEENGWKVEMLSILSGNVQDALPSVDLPEWAPSRVLDAADGLQRTPDSDSDSDVSIVLCSDFAFDQLRVPASKRSRAAKFLRQLLKSVPCEQWSLTEHLTCGVRRKDLTWLAITREGARLLAGAAKSTKPADLDLMITQDARKVMHQKHLQMARDGLEECSVCHMPVINESDISKFNRKVNLVEKIVSKASEGSSCPGSSCPCRL